MSARRIGCGLAWVLVFALFTAMASSAQDVSKQDISKQAISKEDITKQDTAKDDAQAKTQPAVWADEQWPFPIDQWGTGIAFHCTADQCGRGTYLYLRAKIGFCRCATGVSHDDEIDRVGDLELIGTDYTPVAPGHAVTAGIMAGRARLFAVTRPLQSAKTILTIALANKCDAIVATIVAEPDDGPQEINALDFLRSARVQEWVEAQHHGEAQ
jgi:hypothetical protein